MNRNIKDVIIIIEILIAPFNGNFKQALFKPCSRTMQALLRSKSANITPKNGSLKDSSTCILPREQLRKALVRFREIFALMSSSCVTFPSRTVLGGRPDCWSYSILFAWELQLLWVQAPGTSTQNRSNPTDRIA